MNSTTEKQSRRRNWFLSNYLFSAGLGQYVAARESGEGTVEGAKTVEEMCSVCPIKGCFSTSSFSPSFPSLPSPSLGFSADLFSLN